MGQTRNRTHVEMSAGAENAALNLEKNCDPPAEMCAEVTVRGGRTADGRAIILVQQEPPPVGDWSSVFYAKITHINPTFRKSPRGFRRRPPLPKISSGQGWSAPD